MPAGSEGSGRIGRRDGANAWQIFRRMTRPHLRRYRGPGALLRTIIVATFALRVIPSSVKMDEGR